MKVAIIGFGGRGALYSSLFGQYEGVETVAVCDIKQDRRKLAKDRDNIQDNHLFESEKAFFAQGKIADLLVVSTPDSLHTRHALAGLELGYDLLLEKPIATTLEDCELIYNTAMRLNRKVFVCHVLRYAPFFSNIAKELSSGEYGKVSTINLTENVAYWHQAHSYVRGNWRNSHTSSPMIIAKSCHDLDLLCWFVGRECKSVSSMGSLNFFTRANSPEGSSERCLNCAVKNECAYDAERFYLTERFDQGIFKWPVDVLSTTPDRNLILKALQDGPYGRCVFRCDNDVVDHQVVNMEFDGGITAHLTMTAFSKDSYREIHVHCEKGEIFGNMNDNILNCNIFGKSSHSINLNVEDTDFGHGGGDALMIKDIVASYSGKPTEALTDIKYSMASHFVGFAAENSRINGGKLVIPTK